MTSQRVTARSAGTSRPQALTYAAVAGVSLALGVVGTLLALRSSREAPTSPAAAAHEASPTGHEGMAGMPSERTEGHPSEAKGQTVYISPARQQLIGVRTTTVAREPLRTTIRTVGTLAYDETRVTQVNTKIAGWVDRVFVDYVGKLVRRGEPLLSVYSPALVATQREYLLALKGVRQSTAHRSPEADAAGESLRTATRERLKLWDISNAQIDELERTGKVQRTLTLYAPFDGVVLERNTFAGQYITPEMSTVKLADLSTIWVVGQIFEYELGRVQVGQGVEIQFPYGQAPEALEGRISFIYPDIDPQTRRAKIRAEFRNPGFEFKPDSYVTLVIASDQGEALSVPKEALIDTGVKRYVILAHPNGYFEPREVEVGPPTDDVYPVIRGLKEGDTIVTSALFLIDSETNLQAAMQAMSLSMPGMDMGGGKEGGEMPAQQGPAAGHSGHAAPAAEP
jgi:Cu(I)/Ag(I) efflux system membrane fusion protein